MAIVTTLAGCNVNAALNGPDGATDLPSTLDDAIRFALSFIAQLRDGVASGGGALWMTGMVAPFATASAPTGWLKLNGQLVSRTTYASLFAFANTTGLIPDSDFYGSNLFGRFSVGDGSSTFRIPDMRAMFLRGLDEGRGIDGSRSIGSYEEMNVPSHGHGVTENPHSHTGTTNNAGAHAHTTTENPHTHNYGLNNVNAGGGGSGAPSLGGNSVATSSAVTGLTINPTSDHSHLFTTAGATTGLSIQLTGGEGRPKNLAWPFYIKY